MKIKKLLYMAVLSLSCLAASKFAAATPLIFDPIPDIENDTAAWTQMMKSNGEALKRNHVRQIFLVHGTFVGNDPSGLINFLSNIDSSHSPLDLSGMTAFLQQGQKKLIAIITQDQGNYTDSYVTKLCETLGNDICNKQDNFEWGSGDYHFARLDGTLELAQRIAERITEKHIARDERILLLGHSHAGQVFALLTTLLQDGEKAQQLKAVISASKKISVDRKQRLSRDLNVIKSVYLDFVTFGTPVRYGWGNYDRFRLLPVINHRANSTLLGIPAVRDGDYVQQWGVEGTDLPSDAIVDNSKLDSILDHGLGPNAFVASLNNKGRRQPIYWTGKPICENLLVDYRDNYQGLLPVPLPTYSIGKVFGHGVYTTEKAMLFNINLIVKNWYSS